MPALLSEPGVSTLRGINPLLDPLWDEILSRRPDATLFHSSAWARVLAETYYYHPLYFAADSGEVPAVFCAFEVDSWVTGRRGISLPFTDECSHLESPESDGRSLFEHALRLGRERQWKSFEIRGVELEEDRRASLSFYAHTLDLARSVEVLFASFDGSVRRAVRKAERSELKVTMQSTFESVREYYELHCLTRGKHGLPPQPFLFFQNIYRHLISQGQGFIASARLNDRPVAAALFLHRGDRVHYKFGASDPRFDDLRANNLVMWRAIQHCAAQGFALLDFGRTSLDNVGLRKYKLHWGTRESRLHYAKWDFRNRQFTRDTDRSTGLKNRVFRLLPSGLNRFFGTLLYPHIA